VWNEGNIFVINSLGAGCALLMSHQNGKDLQNVAYRCHRAIVAQSPKD